LRYVDNGTGWPVLFIHGLGGASTLDYASVAADPGLAGFRRLLVDLVGSGGSDRPDWFDYSIAGQARCLDAFLADRGLGPVVLFGHSLGGAVALSLAALDPGRVAGVILTEANLDPGGGFWSRAIAGQTSDGFARTGYAELLATAEADHNPWAATLRLSSSRALHAEAVSLVAGATPAWRDVLYGLACPRCYVFGAHSLPDPDLEELPRHGVRTLVVSDCGHNMAWENPAGLAVAVASGLVDVLSQAQASRLSPSSDSASPTLKPGARP
jgi:pimeloyl-ACP methyl ester carboxylesterase